MSKESPSSEVPQDPYNRTKLLAQPEQIRLEINPILKERLRQSLTPVWLRSDPAEETRDVIWSQRQLGVDNLFDDGSPIGDLRDFL